MTYNVFSGTLNPTQSINHISQVEVTNELIIAVHRQFLAFAICYRPSVCLSSVTFVRPTQAVEIFGISTALSTLAIR